MSAFRLLPSASSALAFALALGCSRSRPEADLPARTLATQTRIRALFSEANSAGVGCRRLPGWLSDKPGETANDGWEHRMTARCAKGVMRICSNGPDGREDSTDDVCEDARPSRPAQQDE
jgi:hypothetical protein